MVIESIKRSAIRNPQSPTNPQSEIDNPQ